MGEDVRYINIEYFFNKIYYAGEHVVIWFQNLDISHLGGWAATILGILFFICVIIMIYTRMRIYEIEQETLKKYSGHFQPKTRQVTANDRWTKIEGLFSSANPSDWRVAIIEADSMLDELIVSLGYPGDDLGSRLRAITSSDFPALQSAWEAHKVRNKIAHEGMNYQLSKHEVDITRRHFEFVFRDAGVI